MGKIAVIMCVWQRLHTLEKTLHMLENQTDEQFEFFIWNNNPNIKEIEDLINPKRYSFKISSINSNKNIGGIGRFYYAKNISEDFKYVIFIDDDQEFDKNLVKVFREEAKPDSISGWWAYKIFGEYHQRTSCNPYEEADYIGTGGMICPSKIFQDPRLFSEIPKEYLFIEDLWLSYYSKYEHKYLLQKSKINMKFMPNENTRNQYNRLKNLKDEFNKFLKHKYEF